MATDQAHDLIVIHRLVCLPPAAGDQVITAGINRPGERDLVEHGVVQQEEANLVSGSVRASGFECPHVVQLSHYVEYSHVLVHHDGIRLG